MPSVHIILPAVRANTRMNQQEWANALGVDKSTVFNWESGNTEPTGTQIREMSRLSGIPMDFIYCGKQS